MLTANPVEVISQSWFANSSSETIIFQLTGLTPNGHYNAYMYGAGPNNGNGASFSLPTANQGTGYGTGAGWDPTGALGSGAGTLAVGAYVTEPTGSSTFHSVFSASGGNNPTPEQGLSWVLLPGMADPNGNLSILVQVDALSTSKGYLNGFQLQPLVPEPATLGLIGAAAAGLLTRRRKEE
jgi:hypothetical protein